ncbi:hypothetical protein [Photorhabdus sp. CRCIA-P01]|uniref:hypothetical protein n=1 Tax=Photorhabdus sp. CRCIA-P01 TaxID=2019570 RepID=UPI0018E5414B|nr:hypothetical protein [Photorhabdus sp. CRCIA-P01]
MKLLIIDLLGLTGFGLLTFGLYMQYGTAIALQAGGGGLLAFALIAAWRNKRVT